MEHKTTKATILNTNEAEGIVECIFSVFGILDGGNDIVHNGSFTKTWRERAHKIKMLDSHNFDSVLSALGKPLEFRELSRAELPENVLQEYPEATGGAWAKVQFNMKTQAGHDSFWHIAHGDIDEWSYGYDAVDKDISKTLWRGKEVTARNLRTIKQYELSPCLWGMNPATSVVSAKSAEESQEEESPEEEKAGRVYSTRNLEKLRAAYLALGEALGGFMEPEENEEASKDNGATGPQKSEEPPTSNDRSSYARSASEAGPAEDDSTRQIIELELQKLQLLEV